MPPDGFSLDLDSTVFQRRGNQEGAKRGYNLSRPGRNSHHPLLAFFAEAPLVLHAGWRCGNTGSAPEQRKPGFKRPATLRAARFIGGAVLGKRSRTPVLDIAKSWGEARQSTNL